MTSANPSPRASGPNTEHPPTTTPTSMPTSMATGTPVVVPEEPRLDRAEVVVQSIVMLVCAPLALLLLVLVEVQGWPSWWLIVSGMLVAWTGDALWTLLDHPVTVRLARRRERHRAQQRAHRDDAGRGHPVHRPDRPPAGDPR